MAKREAAPRGRIYVGSRESQAGPGDVFWMDRPGLKGRTLKARRDLRNHSPDGFQWGYGGSGPAQLALALLCDATGDDELAQRVYQKFKFEIVAGLPDSWRLLAGAIADFAKSLEHKVDL